MKLRLPDGEGSLLWKFVLQQSAGRAFYNLMNVARATRATYRELPGKHFTGATSLYLDFLHEPASVESFFPPPFDDRGALDRLVEQVSKREYAREDLKAALLEMADDYQASDRARSNIDLLAHKDALVVFSGQQVGMFTGPLYTIYKALSTERWAADLTQKLGRPVVPCFWFSTDDHDFAEVDHVRVPRGDDLLTLHYKPRSPSSGDPVGRIVIDSEMEVVIRELEDAMPHSEFSDDVFRTLRECYSEGTRFASAFGRLWFAMFPQSGLIPVSPCNTRFKQLARPYFEGALKDGAKLYRAYSDSSAALTRSGYHQQVYKNERQTLLFYQQFKRHSLYHDDDGGYVWEGGEPVTAEWLAKTIADRPDYFSPNVLLRPVVQNGVFPTIGVTLGPSETAYYAQIGGIHDHFGVPRPLILPRTSVSIIEGSVARRIAKLDIRIEALQKDRDAEIARVLRASFPTDLERQFDRAEQRVGEAFDEIHQGVVDFEVTLDKPLRAAAARAKREMRQVAQKAYAANKRKLEESEAQIRRVSMQLFPDGGFQERTFNVVYYWARYGPDFLTGLYDNLPAGSRSHLLWEL